MMKILIDNGHGENTKGKQSPDGRLKEYQYSRDIADRLVSALRSKGYDAERIVLERADVPLKERCKRVNDKCKCYGAKNVLLVSIHNNAAGADGKWHEASGFTAHVCLNASAESKALARSIWAAALEEGLQGNRSVPDSKYIAQNLAMCRDTKCAAVLTENLFQDNKDDVDLLLSEDGKRKIVEAHLKGIIRYLGDEKY